MRKLIILSLILLAAYSCKKDDNGNGGQTIASGILVENHTNKPIPNAVVYLTAQKRGSWSGGWGMNGSGYQKTDSTGHFQFSFFAHPDSMYGIWPRADSKLYFDGPAGEDGSIRYWKDNSNLTVRVNTKGWIKYVVINESPLDTLEYLHINDNNIPALNELIKDTSIYSPPGVGNDVYNISYWLKKKHGNEKHIIDKIFLNAFDTSTYIIKF